MTFKGSSSVPLVCPSGVFFPSGVPGGGVWSWRGPGWSREIRFSCTLVCPSGVGTDFPPTGVFLAAGPAHTPPPPGSHHNTTRVEVESRDRQAHTTGMVKLTTRPPGPHHKGRSQIPQPPGAHHWMGNVIIVCSICSVFTAPAD